MRLKSLAFVMQPMHTFRVLAPDKLPDRWFAAALYLLGASLKQDPALIQHGDALGDVKDIGNFMADHDLENDKYYIDIFKDLPARARKYGYRFVEEEAEAICGTNACRIFGLGRL